MGMGAPKVPQPVIPPPVPEPAPTPQNNPQVDAEKRAARDMAAGLGFNNTILTSSRGTSAPTSERRSLLGGL